MFNCALGQYSPDQGSVALRGIDVSRWGPNRRARNGLARTFQLLQVFIDVGARQPEDSDPRPTSVVFLDKPAAGVNLTMLLDIEARTRDLNANDGVTFAIVEHNMEFIFRLAHGSIVMAEGSVLMIGSPEEVRNDQRVVRCISVIDDPILRVMNVVGGYGSSTVLHETSSDIQRGAITTIIGPNGAGKSTAIKAIFWMVKIRSGSIIFEGRRHRGIVPSRAVEAGDELCPPRAERLPRVCRCGTISSSGA